ncbi:MAG: DUF2244 domain-containing protein [Gammaproteobacteria bacterium]|nr:DUF2244 domain-containing protein [Gammaproteobacteria bacterium]
MLAVNPDAAMHHIVIVPNRSLSVAGLWLFYVSIVTLTLTLGLWFALNGFWPVLAYASVEMLLLGLCLFLCWRQGHYGEVITVNGEHVLIDKHHGRHSERREFSRYWAHLVVHEPLMRLHPRRLYIRSHGQECEIGKCLTEAERESLEKRLAELLEPLGKTGSS